MLRVLIRQEKKNRWEARAPLTPSTVAELVAEGLELYVERSPIRIYKDDVYEHAGATLTDDHSQGDVILGIKEPEMDDVLPGKIHVAFSHTIKGQAYNMPLLQAFMDRKCTLIDYETICDEAGKRLIAFGRYAGIAGAVDTFHIAGRKFADAGRETALSDVNMTHTYGDIERLKTALGALKLRPDANIRAVIVGSGNVGKGAAEVCEWMGLKRINAPVLRDNPPAGNWYAVLRTQDVVRRKDGEPFDWQQYLEEADQAYESCFEDYLGKFDILLQTPYWEPRFPKQLPRDLFLKAPDHIPQVIGDISCDIEGSLDCTLRESTIDQPAYTYDAANHQVRDGVFQDGPTVMAIDHLPCELATDATDHFSRILRRFLPEIANMDLEKPLTESGLSSIIQAATIVYKGQLTPPYEGLAESLKASQS